MSTDQPSGAKGDAPTRESVEERLAAQRKALALHTRPMQAITDLDWELPDDNPVVSGSFASVPTASPLEPSPAAVAGPPHAVAAPLPFSQVDDEEPAVGGGTLMMAAVVASDTSPATEAAVALQHGAPAEPPVSEASTPHVTATGTTLMSSADLIAAANAASNAAATAPVPTASAAESSVATDAQQGLPLPSTGTLRLSAAEIQRLMPSAAPEPTPEPSTIHSSAGAGLAEQSTFTLGAAPATAVADSQAPTERQPAATTQSWGAPPATTPSSTPSALPPPAVRPNELASLASPTRSPTPPQKSSNTAVIVVGMVVLGSFALAVVWWFFLR